MLDPRLQGLCSSGPAGLLVSRVCCGLGAFSTEMIWGDNFEGFVCFQSGIISLLVCSDQNNHCLRSSISRSRYVCVSWSVPRRRLLCTENEAENQEGQEHAKGYHSSSWGDAAENLA